MLYICSQNKKPNYDYERYEKIGELIKRLKYSCKEECQAKGYCQINSFVQLEEKIYTSIQGDKIKYKSTKLHKYRSLLFVHSYKRSDPATYSDSFSTTGTTEPALGMTIMLLPSRSAAASRSAMSEKLSIPMGAVSEGSIPESSITR